MDIEIARELSVDARNLIALGASDLQVFQHLARIHAPFNAALFFRARARGHALFNASGLTDTSPWPLEINFPYPIPPSMTPPVAYQIFAIVLVEVLKNGDLIWKTMISEMSNGSAGATARAIINFDAGVLAADYMATLVSWKVDFWR